MSIRPSLFSSGDLTDILTWDLVGSPMPIKLGNQATEKGLRFNRVDTKCTKKVAGITLTGTEATIRGWFRLDPVTGSSSTHCLMVQSAGNASQQFQLHVGGNGGSFEGQLRVLFYNANVATNAGMHSQTAARVDDGELHWFQATFRTGKATIRVDSVEVTLDIDSAANGGGAFGAGPFGSPTADLTIGYGENPLIISAADCGLIEIWDVELTQGESDEDYANGLAELGLNGDDEQDKRIGQYFFDSSPRSA